MSVDTYLCPGCDREVPVGSRGCPYCNPPSKRRKTLAKPMRKRGQSSSGVGLDLPDEDFDYDAFVAREFGHLPHRRTGVRWYWWITAVVLLVLIVLAGFSLFGWGQNAWR